MESEEFPTLDPVMAAWFSFTIGDYEKLTGEKSEFLFSLILIKLFDTMWKKLEVSVPKNLYEDLLCFRFSILGL